MSRAAFDAVRQNEVAKGDVLAVARVAGIMAAKRTAELIPLCHPLPLSHVDVTLDVREEGVELVDDVSKGHDFVAIEDWRYDPLAARETGVVLSETDHVMAVRLGENGWMVTLERFLLQRTDEVEQLLSDASL